MRSAVVLLAIVALAFGATDTTTYLSTSFTVSESTQQIFTATQSAPVTKSSAAETTRITTYTVTASEVQTATTPQVVTSTTAQSSAVPVTTAVTASDVVTSTQEGSKTVTGTKTALPPASTFITVPDLSGKWVTSDIVCSSDKVFDSAYEVAFVNTTLFVFDPVDAVKFAGGIVQEYNNGSFVGISSALSFCTGNATGNVANIRCIVPASGTLTIPCSATLTRGAATTSTYTVSTVAPTETTPAAYTNIAGRWAVSNVKCAESAFDKAYDVSQVNNTVYLFTGVESANHTGLVSESDAQSFNGVTGALLGCKGVIRSSTTASLSCLINKAQCSADLTLEDKITTTTVASTTEESSSASMAALSFVLLAAIALF